MWRHRRDTIRLLTYPVFPLPRFGGPLDPFRLACPHCASKIVVRHEQLLGQTLPCPKCKDPVVVPSQAPAPAEPALKVGLPATRPLSSSAPQAGPRTGSPIIDSTAMTKVGDFDWNELMANEDLSTRVENGGETGLRFRSANEPDFIPLPSTYAPIFPMPASESDRPIHKQAWLIGDLAKRRQMLTLATIAITGTLFAILCFVVFLRMVGTKDKSIVIAPSIVPSDSDVKKPEAVVQSELVQTAVPNPDLASDDPAQTGGFTPIDPTESLNEIPTPPPNPATMLVPSSPSSSPDIPNGPKNDEGDAITSLFHGLEVILGTGKMSDDLSAQNSALQELNIENAPESLAQVFYPMPKPVPNWDEKTKLVFQSFQVKDISILRCFDMFGRMADIGITVDWQSCRVAGIDLSKKIEINEKGKSIAELVEKIILTSGLAWRLDGSGLPVVSAPKTAMESKVRVDWSTAGLFPDGSEQEGCNALIRLWGYDNVCRFGEGQLLWSEQATPIEKANMQASLCELARVRNLDANHPWTKATASPLIFSSSYWNNSFAALERRIGPTIFANEKRPIPDLLMTAAAELKLNLVIDWQNVWSHGLTPKESTAIVLGGRTFPQTARRFLNDYALEIVPIFDDTVWLTTREERRRLIRVVPVRLPKNYKLDDLRQSLRILAPVVANDFRFRVEPVPGTEDLFFARICSPRADQLNDPDVMIGLGWPDHP